MIAGIGAANIATAQAALTDVTSARNRTQGLAILGAAFGLGFIFGPALASIGLSLSGGNYQTPALIAVVCLSVAIFTTLFIFRETLPVADRVTGTRINIGLVVGVLPKMLDALRRPELTVLLLVILFQQVMFSLVETFLSTLSLTRIGLAGSGTSVIFVFIGVVSLIVQLFAIGPLSRRFGERRLVFAGLFGLALGISLLAFTPRLVLPGYSETATLAEIGGLSAEHSAGETIAIVPPPQATEQGYGGIGWAVVSLIPFVLGAALLQPNINSLITRRVARHEIGGILGISAGFLSIANTIGPLAGGAIFNAVGLTPLYLGGGIFLFMIFGAAVLFLKPGAETERDKSDETVFSMH